MSFSPGSRLGPYEIAAPLGAGGMGEVYRARDTRLGRDVAIKVLPPDLTSTPEARARFEREAHAISHLNHPSICAVHDVGREGEIDYLVMELVSGGSLRDRMTRKPLPLEQVLDLGVQIADALEAAHARGIVHRGLRPENVLLTEQGHVKVTGFGLTTPGQTVGAAAYMSPEQARGEEVDARSDAFSLGAVLYEMTSGHRAFEGSTAAAIFGTILDRTPAPVSVLRKGVPAELDRIIGKALEKDRELRYQTAGEVRSDLKRLERDLESSRAHAAGAGGRPGSRARAGAAVALPALVIARRRLIRIAWIAAACLAFASAIFVATRLAHQESARRAVRLSLEAPAALLEMHSPRISPDGRFIAFIGIDSTDVRLYVRPMKAPAARLLPGTEGSGRPFWPRTAATSGSSPARSSRRSKWQGGSP